jgi:hypothetical protein
MHIVNNITLESGKYFKINFNGDDLSCMYQLFECIMVARIRYGGKHLRQAAVNHSGLIIKNSIKASSLQPEQLSP